MIPQLRRDVWKEGSFCIHVLSERGSKFENSSSAGTDILHLELTTAGALFVISISSKN